jgi:DNA polymerase
VEREVIKPTYKGKYAPKCEECPLSKVGRGRNSIYFVPSEIRPGKTGLIGESPGKDEVNQGKPFVGKAGQFLFDDLLPELSLKREDFTILNIIKCQPPKDKWPGVKAVRACAPALEEELKLAKLPYLVALGKNALMSLIDEKPPAGTGITKLRSYFCSRGV